MVLQWERSSGHRLNAGFVLPEYAWQFVREMRDESYQEHQVHGNTQTEMGLQAEQWAIQASGVDNILKEKKAANVIAGAESHVSLLPRH